MTISARSTERFPSISGKASCEFHAQQGVICTPMDCEFFRAIPDYLSQYERAKHVAYRDEEAAVERAREVLNPQRPKPTKSVPTKKNKKK